MKTKNFKIESIRKLVFDEADRFFEEDFVSDLELIKTKTIKLNQTLLFTANLTDKTQRLCTLFMKSPKIIEISNKYENIKTLKDYYCFIGEQYKLVTLHNLIKQNNDSSIIVFTSLFSSTQKINSTLIKMGISSECRHGKMNQSGSEKVIKNFKEGVFSVLLTTDLASRGLDIPQVSLIINFDLPELAKTYIHRIGRTAIPGREGSAISLVTQYDVIQFQKLEYALHRKIECFEFDIQNDYERFPKYIMKFVKIIMIRIEKK
jgi:ATP-dependent RNA helicase DDX47/RRP3